MVSLMKYTTLVDTATLAGLLGSDAVAVVDCRFELANPDAGEAAYQGAHIPGAVFAHLDRDLSGPKTGRNGRHPLPSPEALTATLGRLGIDNEMQVIAYDQDTGMFASRLWWMLRWLGHSQVAVLDGGFARWTNEGRPTVTGVETRKPRTFTGVARPEMTVSAREVGPDGGLRVVDARAPERYRGDIEPIDPVAGHIPGAVNYFYMQNLVDGRFRSPWEIQEAWKETVGSARPEDVVSYCGSGVTACHNLLALEHAGLRGARLYPGSWSEWVADPSRPVERG
jgi:thiosulfate/3-mercaptopyruvate sulfurtransferase